MSWMPPWQASTRRRECDSILHKPALRGVADSSTSCVITHSNDVRESTDGQSMRAFYSFLLPWKSLFVWLNHDLVQRPGRLFDHREFAFTLQNEAYLRYNSFSTWEELKKEVLRLNPARFEIGPVYSAKVSRLQN